MRFRMTRSSRGTQGAAMLGAAVLSLLLSLASGALAVPGTINYQGMLVEDGTPVDGTKSVHFRIYDAATGGTSLWTEVQDVTFTSGLFSVLLGSTEAIPETVFNGSRRWLSVSIADGAEILPRSEIASVGYAFRSEASQQAQRADSATTSANALHADAATNADKLDGYESSQFAGATHTHDSRYYTQTQLGVSDGTPPNQGSNLVNWDNLVNVPAGFADGVDNTGGGVTDHGQLTGLLDNDHPQYALWDSLKASDGTPPNTGANCVNWDNLAGVPAGFADGRDSITTDASLITSGAMSPERIEGTAVVNSDPRLLTAGQRAELTGGGITLLHTHPETSHISAITAGNGLSGGGAIGNITISHAADASALPFAHHFAPLVASAQSDSFNSGDPGKLVVDSLTVHAPTAGFLYMVFSASQELDVYATQAHWAARRYIATYGLAIDDANTFVYHVTSSMQDTTFVYGIYVPTRPVMGTIVRPVTAGSHTIYFLAEAMPLDSGARDRLDSPSLVAVFYQFDDATYPTAFAGAAESKGSPSGQGQSGEVHR